MTMGLLGLGQLVCVGKLGGTRSCCGWLHLVTPWLHQHISVKVLATQVGYAGYAGYTCFCILSL